MTLRGSPRIGKSLDDAIAALPKDVEFLLLRGIAESPDPADRGQGSVATAMPYYEKALAIAPGSFAAHHYMAHAYENTNRAAQALPHASAFAKEASTIPHARHMHGHSLWRLGRVFEAIAEFEAADRIHREYAKTEKIPLEADWHVEHNLGLLGTSLSYTGQVKRAETLLKFSFALPTNLLVQAYNKREWPMFLRARGRYAEAEAAAKALLADPNPVVQATGHIEVGHVLLAQNRWGDAATASNAALRLLRNAPGGAIAADRIARPSRRVQPPHRRTYQRPRDARGGRSSSACGSRARRLGARRLFSSRPSPAPHEPWATGSWPDEWPNS